MGHTLSIKNLEFDGLDSTLIRRNHFELYKSLSSKKLLQNDLVPDFILNLPQKYKQLHKKIYPGRSFHNDEDIEIFNSHLSELTYSLTGEGYKWFEGKKFNKSLDLFLTTNNLKIDHKTKLVAIIFNFYIADLFENFLNEIELQKKCVRMIEEIEEIALEINTHFNLLIDRISIKDDISHDAYCVADTLLKRARAHIQKSLIGEKSLELTSDKYEFEHLEKNNIKYVLYPLSFKHGKKENIALNKLILDIYLLFRLEKESVYLPKVTLTLSFINTLDVIKNKIPPNSKETIRKKIKDLIKRERHLQQRSNRNIQKIINFQNEEDIQKAILKDFLKIFS